MNNNGKKKIAIFGGSFDPPHYGHYDIVKNLEKTFDRVIVVPSYISPFKTDASAADAKARLSLVKRFFASEKTEICSREITRKGVSYSVDTAVYLAKKYSDASLTWVIGSEELLRLPEWHDIDRLKATVDFLVVPRPGYAPDPNLIKALKKRKIKLKTAKFNGLDISSTRIKIDTAFGRPNKYVPEFVRKAAEKNGLFDPYRKYVAALYRHGLSERRINHTYGVACRGAELAKLYGADVSEAVITCLLHDIAKNVNIEEYSGKVDIKGFPIPTAHGPIGAYIATREFGVSDEIAHAIRYHSTGCGDMSLLDEIVYLADKTEEGRNYKEVYYLRYLCGIDREIAMLEALKRIVEYTSGEAEDGRQCGFTSDAIELYKKRCEGKEIPKMPEIAMPAEFEKSVLLPVVRAGAPLGAVKSKAVRIIPEKNGSVRIVPENSKSVTEHKGAATHSEAAADKTDVRAVAETVAKELCKHKAHDVVIIDLDGKTIVADYFVIASVTSTTAVKALRGYAEDIMTKKYGLDPNKRDIDNEWIALDYGGVIIHIFTDKTREFYNIERLWSDGKNVTEMGD